MRRDANALDMQRYPLAMRRLPLAVRLKAIEIANAMLAEGYGEGQAIRMAIAAAETGTSQTSSRQRPWARRSA